MGLFDKRDKKRRDDFDSPVEAVDLDQVQNSEPVTAVGAEPVVSLDRPKSASASPATASARFVAPMPRSATTPPSAAHATTPPAAAAPPTPAPARTTHRQPAVAPDADAYGIDRAIELMRTLPTENIQLVVQVVKFSLESVGIKLPVIIEDATRRQRDLRGRVDVLAKEISELESEIRQRKEEISRLEADYRETTVVRERLEMAEGVSRPTARSGTPSSSPVVTIPPKGSGPVAASPVTTPSIPSLPGGGPAGTK